MAVCDVSRKTVPIVFALRSLYLYLYLYLSLLLSLSVSLSNLYFNFLSLLVFLLSLVEARTHGARRSRHDTFVVISFKIKSSNR